MASANEEDKNSLKDLLTETFERFRRLNVERESAEAESTNASSSSGDGTNKKKGVNYQLLTLKKRSDGSWYTAETTTKEGTIPPKNENVHKEEETTRTEASVKPKVSTEATDSSTSKKRKKKKPAPPPPSNVIPFKSTLPPKIYSEEDLHYQWHSYKPPESFVPLSVTLQQIQLNDKLDNVLVKLREESEPIDTTRTPTREDHTRLMADFSNVFHSMEKHVKDNADCRRIFFSLFQDDFRVLLMRYIHLFRVRVDITVLDTPNIYND